MITNAKTIYIAGPMRGCPLFNFPAFDEAAEDLREQGWEVISPAEMDREVGFDPATDEPTAEFLKEAMERDVSAIIEDAEALAVLPGWEMSTGANAEMALARWKKIPVFLYPEMTLIEDEDILEEALRITKGSRQASYGPPDQDFKRTAQIWSALKGVEFEAREVALFMVAIKMSREMHQRKRDNWVDIAGYARCGSFCR